MQTHNKVISFGRYEGELWTRVPADYLRWLINQKSESADIAEAELKRRGTVQPMVDISHHAINSASERCLEIWQAEKEKDEGISAWLHRKACLALDNDTVRLIMKTDTTCTITVDRMQMVFKMGLHTPVLKTVYVKNPGVRTARKGLKKRPVR